MGRKKSHPVRSRGILAKSILSDKKNADQNLASSGSPESADANHMDGNSESTQPLFVEIDRSHWDSDVHFDIAEIVLKDMKFSDEFTDNRLIEDRCKESNIALRFRLPRVADDCFRLGHWPVFSVDSIFLEFVLERHDLNDKEMPVVVFSGVFDGSDEGVSGLVHLVSQKFMTLRPVSEDRILRNDLSFRARVEILGRAFDACESLLEVARKPWKKSMMSVMSWLRPDVTTSEAKYGISQLEFDGLHECPETAGRFNSRKLSGFDAAGFYEAIRPSKEEPMLEDELPDLLPVLRPYQRRAAYWMVQRERGLSRENDKIQSLLVAPLCVPVVFLESDSRMFYNPFSGNVALHQESSSSYVAGGILADEMGLGKTVELLACILSHRMSSLEECLTSDDDNQDKGSHIKRLKQERVECVCGAITESPKYKGLWVQCDICDAWQHADCVGYSSKVNRANCQSFLKKRGSEKDSSIKSKGHARKNDSANIIEIDGNFICPPCSELIEASHATISTGATLIVCPAPILAQWHSEIIRHTKSGSLKTCIYEGARSIPHSSTLKTDMRDLASADIVLTTYDVLKEDLSHDSDRHDGDRRCMRFQKRYPVVPTLLTRMSWWRLCLDEAQMVESNATAVTEMALRLRARHRWCITGTPIQRRLDDLYGLLHFLGAVPFDVYRWWVEVIRNPYERRDSLAMEFVHYYFKQIMWRSTKVHISEELQLPPQEECASWLTFSPVEEHFYQKQHESCVRCAHEVIERLKEDILTRESVSGFDSFLSHSEAAKLLYPLLKLRQACCHPQVGSSGLRSLQQSPMTMDEILDVLISKAKTEGEEALRRIVVALNGLAAIAAIEQDYIQAVSLYREALVVAEENTGDFRLDPLLSLHIHHNLIDLIPLTSGYLQSPSTAGPCYVNSENTTKPPGGGKFDQCYVKRRKVSKSSQSSEQLNELPKIVLDFSSVGVNGAPYNDHCQISSGLFADGFLRQICESIKQKYLSVFISKLVSAQQEFRNTYMMVCNMFTEFKDQHVNWWLEALNLIEQNKNFSDELIRKIDQAVSGAVNGAGTSRVSLRFRSISGLKLTIQSGLDSLENSRQALLERLTEIDGTMNEPKDDDIERVRFCSGCQSGDGPLCIHCELNDLFQVYEARLFHLKKGNSSTASAEEAIDLQKQKKELNLFFRSSKKFRETSFVDDENKGQRHASTNVVVYKCPSDLEIVLGVIRSYSKSHLGRQGLSSATKHLHLFEAMRKEFSHARCLSSAQAQLLRAHDEIKMSTSRLRLKESEDEPTAINVLSSEELIPSSLQFSSDKTLSLSSLSRIKGQLRYLKGLILSKQKIQDEHTSTASMVRSTILSAVSQPHGVKQNERQGEADDEPCPICHEKLSYQKMVFPCGHVTCCKCCFEMTEQAVIRLGRCQQKWVMCPTCRQQTELENIAFVDDKQNIGCDLNSLQGQDMSEISIMVRGSYGTKIEAVTRRILWIKDTDQEAKVLVFSSWNDVLDVLEHALHANNISYIRMKGGRRSQVAIAQFKGQKSHSEGSGKSRDEHTKSESIQVLLLLIQHGANGLNLLEAQHVILIEPLLNPAAEAQAINRVHRIGQEKKTFIHRFIVKSTVEESIYKLNQSRNMNPIIGAKSKHQDQPVLTIRDFESLFSPTQAELPEDSDAPVGGGLRHLPPAVAAGLAAERRLMEASSS